MIDWILLIALLAVVAFGLAGGDASPQRPLFLSDGSLWPESLPSSRQPRLEPGQQAAPARPLRLP